MANVNQPDVKDVGNINPLAYSKPIEDVKGISTVAGLIEGSGKLIEGGASALDAVFKQQAKKEGADFGQALFENQISKLGDILSKPADQQQAITNAEEPPGYNAYNQATVDTIQTDASAVGTAQSAAGYQKPGTPLHTLYLAQAEKGAKEIEGRWGGTLGYGDIAREAIEKNTGYSPNKLINQLIAGINQNANAQNKEENRINALFKPLIEQGHYEDVVDSNGKHTSLMASTVLQAIRDKRVSIPDGEAWINRTKMKDAIVTQDSKALELGEKENKVSERMYEGHANNVVFNMVHKDVDTVVTNMGAKRSGQDIEAFITDLMLRGPESLKDQGQALAVKNSLLGRIAIVENLANLEANAPKYTKRGDPTKYSLIEMLGENGDEKFQRILKNQLSHMRNMAESAFKGDTGVAGYAGSMSRLIQDRAELNALTGSMAEGWLNISTIKRLGGDKAADLATTRFLTQNKFGDLYDNMSVTNAQLSMLGQGNWLLGNANDPAVVKAAVDSAIKRGASNPQIFKNLVTGVSQITSNNPGMTDDLKANLIVGHFHPLNYGLVEKFKKEEGADVYSLMTTGALTEEIWRLGKKDPRLWEMYDGWFKNSFGEAVGPSIRDLNKYSAQEWLNLNYNTKTMEFGQKPDTAAYFKEAKQKGWNPMHVNHTAIGDAQTAIDAVNKAMGGFRTFSETTKSDVNSYLYGVLKGLGLENSSLARQFEQAVRTGIKADTTPKGGAQKGSTSPTNDRTEGNSGVMQFDAPQQVATLQQWLKNPAGGAEGSAFDRANSELGLNKQEQNLFNYHTANMTGKGKVMNQDGSMSTVKGFTVTFGDKTYVLPSVWKGKQISYEDAIANATKVGIDNFPSYKSLDEAKKRYDIIHEYMNQDTKDYIERKKAEKAAQ